ncbi:unnamed protein product [Clonostachys rosea]|uniref:Mitochondrial division protein 1 n=1 Tax=Bionectria ochroleuca TaxID=29856 RepID=A0ABY6TTQ0_BIOOC|nr:unnamed protein product [Clonostachys rosea]
MEVLGVAANVIAVVDLSVKVGSLCTQYARQVKNAAANIQRLQNEVHNLKRVTGALQDLLNGPNGDRLGTSRSLKAHLDDSRLLLKRLELDLTPRSTRKLMGKIGLQSLKWPFRSSEVDGLVKEFSRYVEAIDHTLQVEQTNTLLRVDRTIQNMDQKAVMEALPMAQGATFDSAAEQHNPACLPNTRVDLLLCIKEWALKADAKPIFWLNGMAGTGKSTISRSIARSFAETGHLGASFFFKWGEADRGSLSKFFTSIAIQLAQREPAVASRIKSAADSDPYISGKAARYQFDKLILQPLRSIAENWESLPLVIIVDALDECDRDDDIKLLINLLSETKNLKPLKLRILITSRPDLPVRLGFTAAPDAYQDHILHEMPLEIIEHDISLFIRHEIQRIKMEFNSSVTLNRQLSADWPDERMIHQLTAMSVPLFIFAATVCRFISERKFGNPKQQLEEVLRLQGQGASSKLNGTYLPVLNRLIDGLNEVEAKQMIESFQHIVGSIVVLGNAVPVPLLARLLNMGPEQIYDHLDSLHSVLNVPTSEESPIRMLHLSFHDFLVDPRYRGHPFWVDKLEVHSRLAVRCLDIMSDRLRMDICEIKHPGTDRRSVERHIISSYIKPELEYACLYWVYHIRDAGSLLGDNGLVYNFLIGHLLHWLEAMSFLERISESLSLISDLEEFCELQSGRLVDFLQDARRFVRTNMAMIDSAPLQIYSSILAFTPLNSTVRKTFLGQIPQWISLLPEPEESWDQCEQIIEDPSPNTQRLAFSPDGSRLASGKGGEFVHLWSTFDGACTQSLRHGSESVYCMKFSPEGKFMATGSEKMTIRLWRLADGVCVREFNNMGHTSRIVSVDFSADGSIMASECIDSKVCLWSTSTGACIRVLRNIWSVTLSSDGGLLVSVSDGMVVQVWCTSSGACMRKFVGHSRPIVLLAFSFDDAAVISGSQDQTVRVWNLADGTCGNTLRFDPTTQGFVNRMVLSPGRDLIASSSSSASGNDHMIQLWRITDGSLFQQLEADTADIWCITFSPDGGFVASVCGDSTIWLWRTNDGSCIQVFKGHMDMITTIAFSPDGAHIASASWDDSIRLWHTASDGCIPDLSRERHYSFGSYEANSGLPMVLSPDDATLALANDEDTIRLWRTADGACYQQLKPDGGRICSLAFSHDGKLIASGSYNGIHVWDVSNGSCIQKMESPLRPIMAVAFSSDGTTLASTTVHGTTRLWNPIDGTCIKKMEGWGESDTTFRTVFSPDGTTIASAHRHGCKIRFWRISDGTCLKELKINFLGEERFNSYVHSIGTNSGGITFDRLMALFEDSPTSYLGSYLNLWFSRDLCWLTWQGERFFWLPPPFRIKFCVFSESTMAIACASGRVIVMKFDLQPLGAIFKGLVLPNYNQPPDLVLSNLVPPLFTPERI